MIKSFETKMAEHLFDGVDSKNTRKLDLALQAKSVRLLDQINVITDIETLRAPPSNHLEKFAGDYNGYWSIRINIKWRIVFKWIDGNAYNVDIVDYH